MAAHGKRGPIPCACAVCRTDDILRGWHIKGTSGSIFPFKQFWKEIKDEFMLSADGTVGVRKLNKQATRTTNGVIRLNGVLMR